MIKPLIRIALASLLIFSGEVLAACADQGGGTSCQEPMPKGGWTFGACSTGGDFLAWSAQWCLARGGIWDTENVSTGPRCIGTPVEVSEGNFMGIATIAETNFRNACSMSPVMGPWGDTIASGTCGNHQNTFTGSVMTATWAQANFTYKVATESGCNSGEQTASYVLGKTRPAGCAQGSGAAGARCALPPPCDTCRGNPTDVGNGAKRQHETDYESGATGGLSFSRYYNSSGTFAQTERMAENTDFWRHTYASRVVSYVGNAYLLAAIQRADGFVVYFKTNGKELNNNRGAAATIEQVAGPGAAAWRHTTAERDVELYDAAGKLLSITYRAGFVHTLTYNVGGQLETITDSFGRTITLTYNAAGALSTMTDPAGRALTPMDTMRRLAGSSRQHIPATRCGPTSTRTPTGPSVSPGSSMSETCAFRPIRTTPWGA
ncbi:RHS repeat domain-containing protein [Usitatibacter palustris]|uniref:DUF6531 domain-containing protein n=1 Tax=Usitatibacter palustris TaxID=2732487 RepID=A0A6M4H1H5_9PROT|nr:DUF6531 domain-containing protein [Usitatibacter palustris]QJR13339.1 hypothetical protein DSM104440_00122 [Usitatibacter palustris]